MGLVAPEGGSSRPRCILAPTPTTVSTAAGAAWITQSHRRTLRRNTGRGWCRAARRVSKLFDARHTRSVVSVRVVLPLTAMVGFDHLVSGSSIAAAFGLAFMRLSASGVKDRPA